MSTDTTPADSARFKSAYFQQRRDEVPNQELAQDLAAARDQAGIRAIAAHLWDANPQIQSDCIKVLYEVGYRDPALIAAYAPDFIALLTRGPNRLVWGAMIALATIAPVAADALYPHVATITRSIAQGSVITVDNGIKALARIAAANPAYGATIFPYLIQHLETCRPKDVPQHAESIVPAVSAANKHAFIAVVEQRSVGQPAARIARLRKVVKEAELRRAGAV